jgi:hypothetical protein
MENTCNTISMKSVSTPLHVHASSRSQALMQHKERSYSAPEGLLFRQSGYWETVPPGGDSEALHSEGWHRREDWQRYRLAHVSAQLPVLAG